jgi:PAS domain-containing protein
MPERWAQIRFAPETASGARPPGTLSEVALAALAAGVRQIAARPRGPVEPPRSAPAIGCGHEAALAAPRQCGRLAELASQPTEPLWTGLVDASVAQLRPVRDRGPAGNFAVKYGHPEARSGNGVCRSQSSRSRRITSRSRSRRRNWLVKSFSRRLSWAGVRAGTTIALADYLEQAPVVVRTLDGEIIYWPEGTQKMYGYTAQDALGHRSHELLRTVFPARLTEIAAVLKTHWE